MPRWFGKYAGIVTMIANSTTKNTAHVGVLLELRRRHKLCPGTAPSRENANVMREALVTHATPQNSWPTVEISTTALSPAELSAVAKYLQRRESVLVDFGFVTLLDRDVIARSTIQPKIAE